MNEETTNDSTDVVKYAGFWKRFFAYFIDGFVLCAIGFVLGFVVAIIHIDISDRATQLIDIIISWLYFAGMESSLSQATLGKRAIGIKVTDMDGERITFLRATGRYFAKIISGTILLIGYIMAAFTDKKQALHDIIASTLVVVKK